MTTVTISKKLATGAQVVVYEASLDGKVLRVALDVDDTVAIGQRVTARWSRPRSPIQSGEQVDLMAQPGSVVVES